MIGTLNNKNFVKSEFPKTFDINITGLDKKENDKLKNNLTLIFIDNLFRLDEFEIREIINSNNLIEKYSVFKVYPSTLNIKIDKTKFIASTYKDGNNFFLGSNNKLIKSDQVNKNIPQIFGNFEIQNFFELKNEIENSRLDYNLIKKLFFFKSGRWDIEIENGILIKLPKDSLKDSLQLVVNILSDDNHKKLKVIDLRQKKQIVLNE